MSVTVGLSCGHGMRLLDVEDEIPENGPWTFYPLIVEHPLEIGDKMTCLVDDKVQEITGIYAGTVPVGSNGKMELP